eukprot:TRINITY_DN6161_c0_g2_i1.p1 TRINITY_DN6161_c0_g2~~TRINITY_DN6161_c0_g2_i1.p1  ORF type:complete len:213 (-),score=64.25 TRINITY_DN6161_c0_g2_i1:88-726(-)
MIEEKLNKIEGDKINSKDGGLLLLAHIEKLLKYLLPRPVKPKKKNGSDYNQSEGCRIVVFGNDNWGQIFGSPNNSEPPTSYDPYENEAFAELSPSNIVLGSDITIILTKEGQLYSCGKGDYGRLGIGGSEKTPKLTHLSTLADIKIVKVTSSKGSYGHSLAMDTENRIYSWGDGDFGKLGHGDTIRRRLYSIFIYRRDVIYMRKRRFKVFRT